MTPAIGFSALGWRSVRREHAVRTVEVERLAEAALDRRLAGLVDALERVRARESLRDFTDWQDEVLPRSLDEMALAFQASPLRPSAAEPLVRGWFQWELLGGLPMGERPDVFPPGDVTLADQLAAGFGADLVARLEHAPHDVALSGRGAIVRRYPLRYIAANEERGQLIEELLDLNQRGATRQLANVQQRLEPSTATPYIDSFERRTRGGEEIEVRLTPMRWLARPAGSDAPHFLAWRLVHVPADFADRREVHADRWIVQGLAVDISSRLPSRWEAEGDIEIGGGALLDGTPPAIVRRDLAALLGAESAAPVRMPGKGGPRGSLVAPGDDELLFGARVAPGAIEQQWAKMRDRFLLQLAGLAALVAGGFVLLVRMLRRERALVRRKEDFVAAVTHELKTPLTGIRMYAEMLKEGWVSSPDAADRYASRILGESERLGHLVDQVLDLAALERGVAQVHARPGDLGAAVEEAVGLMLPRAQQQGVTLQLDIEAGLPPVVFDPRLVKPLVLNLVDNAIKYGARGEDKTVRVRVARDGERTVVSVADRGPGIDPEIRRDLFRPFQRAEGELTRDTAGVGIGLALVKRYADAHRARVVVVSEPGKGTTIGVRFR
ncbi:MAG: sensor histidine kinase [Planctomycetota bacterium]